MKYKNELKEKAVAMCAEMGVKKAAEWLNIPYSTLAGWYRLGKIDRYSNLRRELACLNSETPRRELLLELENLKLHHTNEILKNALFCLERD